MKDPPHERLKRVAERFELLGHIAVSGRTVGGSAAATLRIPTKLNTRRSWTMIQSMESDHGLDIILDHDLFRKPVSTHRVKPEGMLFGIMLLMRGCRRL
jgi:hypothetical protein